MRLPSPGAVSDPEGLTFLSPRQGAIAVARRRQGFVMARPIRSGRKTGSAPSGRPSRTRLPVYVECGAKRTFAAALDWPGLCRSGRTEADALAALLAYGPRYAAILAGTRLRFVAPQNLAQLAVVERLAGTATTDFGAPCVAPAVDHDRFCDAAELERFETILRAGWRAFDKAVRDARGKTLATGPRGGGRSLQAIVAHVIGADAAYLGAVGWKASETRGARQLAATRAAILAALKASASGGDSTARPARRRAVVGTVLRSAGGVARDRALGDRAACGPSSIAGSRSAAAPCSAVQRRFTGPGSRRSRRRSLHLRSSAGP